MTAKEMLDYLKNNKNYLRDEIGCYKELYASQIDSLLDYITNLQQENERLKVYLKPEYIVNKIEQLEEENKNLRLQLKGTTHCYDEFEHRELKNQIKELQYKYKKALNDLVIVDRLSEMLKCLQEQIKDFGNRGCDD